MLHCYPFLTDPEFKSFDLLQLLDTGMAAAGLRGGHDQTPMISSNYAFDMNTPLQI